MKNTFAWWGSLALSFPNPDWKITTVSLFVDCRQKGGRNQTAKKVPVQFFSPKRGRDTKSKTLSFVLLFCANRLTFRFHVSLWKSFLKDSRAYCDTICSCSLLISSLKVGGKPFFLSSLPLSPFCQPISFPTQKKREGEYRIPPPAKKKSQPINHLSSFPFQKPILPPHLIPIFRPSPDRGLPTIW